MSEFLRITKETLTKENSVEITDAIRELVDNEEAMQEQRDNWER